MAASDNEEMDFEEPQVKGKRKKKDNKAESGKKRLKEKDAEMEQLQSTSNGDINTESCFPPTFSVSDIKNKQRRHFMFMKLKQQKKKEKSDLKKKRKREREALGDKAPPKPIPKTIENQRVFDETVVNPEDDEVALDEGTDEFSSYFNRLTNPKILITTSDRPRGRTVRFCEQLATVIPDSHVYYRRGLALKKIIPQCVARDFTYLIVRRGKDPSEHVPEVILNNFTTRLGHSIGRMFASLFPHDPNFIGRQVATFHNQRDYIFFRFHRYIFKNEKKVGLQELGPRFTLKLRSLQKGTFDSKFGEYEWVHKLREQLADLLGEDVTTEKFAFLKCVGRSLALVKAKQERELKAKSFLPPCAPQPELYLLPRGMYHGGLYSVSPTPELQDIQKDEIKNFVFPHKLPAEKAFASRLPRPKHRTSQKPHSAMDTEEREQFFWEKEKEMEITTDHQWNRIEEPQKKFQEKHPSAVMKTELKITIQHFEFQAKDTPQYSSPPSPPLVTMSFQKSQLPAFATDRDELIEQIKIAKKERKQLEKTRQELVKKAKGLLAQNYHGRNQARDIWKKRYFETKKATVVREETLKRLCQELEFGYQKIQQQLQTREQRRNPRNPAKNTDSKNSLLIQITTEQYEIDNLKRKVDDAKMKLVTEIKLRKQASVEIRALRAELTQKKTQSSLTNLNEWRAPQTF
ncbi:RPF1 factor, partial [Polypterus senegalus]